MFKIIHAEFIAPGIKRFIIEAPRIARKQRPGQFVIVRVCEQGERIPLTIERSDPGKGTVNIVVVMGGGVGTAMAYPTAAALKKAGNRVIVIIGGRNKDLVLLEREMREATDTVYVTTDDGSYGEKGLVTDRLRQLVDNGLRIDLVIAVGPIPMMRAVAEMTRKEHIHTVVSLNPIMIDGTGMCGGCRVLVDGKSEFACVDGPEFDAHRIDFAVLVQRNSMYREAEKRSMDDFKRELEEKKAKSDEEMACAVEARK